ncbi:MAG TPA: hypothetical protein VGE94_14200, partial [Chloroflexota bacterium]
RSERLGLVGEGYAAGESESAGEGDDGETSENEFEVTPTTSIVEVAQASSGTVEAPPEHEATVDSTAHSPEAAAPAPRDRRRRTRRPVAGADTPSSGGDEAVASPPSPTVTAASEAPSHEPSADLPSAGEAPGPIENGTNGGEAPPAPRTRRRVASSRSRSASR